ncbi:MAG: hypothetical protein HFJ35_03115 [Clostridia bacterium]|nr:hypothetical protein [Clostridia bacterium]
MEDIERLETEVLEMNDSSVSAVFNYLKTRKDLYEKFNNKEKSIEQMWNYICDKARKMSKNNVAVVQDNLVFIWAVNYFCKSNTDLGIKEKKAKKVMPPSADETIEEINREHFEKEKQKESEQKKDADNQISMFKEEQK